MTWAAPARAAWLLLAVQLVGGVRPTSAQDTVIPSCSGLAVTLTAPERVTAGKHARVVAQVLNSGTTPLEGVGLTLRLPAHFMPVKMVMHPVHREPNWDGLNVFWEGLRLRPGKDYSLKVKARVAACEPTAAEGTDAVQGAVYVVYKRMDVICATFATPISPVTKTSRRKKARSHGAQSGVCPTPAPFTDRYKLYANDTRCLEAERISLELTDEMTGLRRQLQASSNYTEKDWCVSIRGESRGSGGTWWGDGEVCTRAYGIDDSHIYNMIQLCGMQRPSAGSRAILFQLRLHIRP